MSEELIIGALAALAPPSIMATILVVLSFDYPKLARQLREYRKAKEAETADLRRALDEARTELAQRTEYR